MLIRNLMMLSLALGSILLTATANAQNNGVKKMEVLQIEVKVDEKLFADCKQNLKDVNGLLQCEVFRVPAGYEVLEFDGLMNALHYYKMLSSSSCFVDRADGQHVGVGQMWYSFDPKSQAVSLYPDTMECMDIMIEKNKKLNSPFAKQYVYVIKR